VPGSWDVAGCAERGASTDGRVGTSSCGPEGVRIHAGVPLDKQGSAGRGHLRDPGQAWAGPITAVITGIARADRGDDRVAGEKGRRAAPPAMLCINPPGQDAVGRADAIMNAGRVYR